MSANISPSNGTQAFICSTAVGSDPDQTAYAAMSWIEIGGLTSVGEFGDESASIKTSIINENRVRKNKGTRDAGMIALVCAHDPADNGQVQCSAAERSADRYAFKVIVPDASTGSGTDSVFYFSGLVMSKRLSVGDADKTITRTFNVDIDTDVIEVLGS